MAQTGLGQWRQYPHWARGPARIDSEEIILDEDRATPYYIFQPEGLMFDLANVGAGWESRDTQGVLAFVRRYGLLWHGAADVSTGNCREPLEEVWHEAAHLYWLMDLYVKLREALAKDSGDPLRNAIAYDFPELFASEAPDDQALMDQASIFLAEILSSKLKDCTLSIASSVALDVAPRSPGVFLLQQRPPNLLAAAYVDFAQAVVSRAPMQECPGCDRLFIRESGKQKYHSPSCASTSRWRRWKEKQAT